MNSYVDRKIAEIGSQVWGRITAPGGWLYEQLKRHIAWERWGYAEGFSLRDRERFTGSVADRLYEKGRGEGLRLFGLPIWPAPRLDKDWCAAYADYLVTEFLRDERIKFGDPQYDWSDGHDIADEDLQHWEAA